MKDLLSVINYLRCGKETFPTLAFFDDDEGMSKEELAKLPTVRTGVLHIDTMERELPILSKQSEMERRAYCFYPNNSVSLDGIETILFHFVDIDGGNKEEQLEWIMSAPLPPTLVYSGRAGHKLLYAIENARWDKSNGKVSRESRIYFDTIQMQIIEYFNGDTSKRNPNAPFRLPLTNNYKEIFKNGKVYKEEIILFEPNHVYTQEQLAEAFPTGSKKIHGYDSLSYEDSPKEVREIIECFIGWLDSEGLSYTEYDGKLSYQCPIHDDGTASAYMFYDNLICHCSNGDAELDCAIDKGKPLSWVAKEKGWADLEASCKKLEAKPAEKYEMISLDDMQSTKLVPLQQTKAIATGHVKAVLTEVVSTMKSRQIAVDETTTDIFANIIHELNLQTEGITVCPLEPGGGKSTLMATCLKYMLDQALADSGTIIVVERVETAKSLLEQLGKHIVFVDVDGKAIDAAHYKSYPAAFVMESAYTYKDCKLKLEKYQYGVCRKCEFKEGCKVYKKHREQKDYPIVIMTHARLKMESDELGKYRTWRCKDGNEYERKRIIIDEKPPVVEVITVHNTNLDEFLLDVRSMQLDPEVVSETNLLVKQLRDQITDAVSGQNLTPINPEFTFEYSETWYKKYTGDNVNLLKDIEYVIQNGGRVNHNRLRNIISIVTNRTVQYDFSGYHIAILDGTAKYDMEYRALQSHQMLNTPPIKSFEHLTFFVDFSISSSKGKLTKDAGLLADITRNISIISTKETVLVLCFKELVSVFKGSLSREIKEGRVLINHFGNIKGSNEYSRCTALFLVGTIHKSDPVYINKHEAICGEVENTKVGTVKGVRRFKDLDIEMIKLNDQVVDAIQDILRISIRNNGATAQAKVYMLTKDVAFVNILHNYFSGCELKYWNMSGTYPEWYEQLDKYFGALKQGEIIKKATLREELDLDGEAGKKRLQGYMKKELFTKLLGKHRIATVNNCTYKKVDSFEVECDQAVK